MKTSKLIWPALLLFAVTLLSCSSAPVTGRKQLNMMSDTEVVKMSIAAFEQMKADNKISTHPAYNDMLQRVGGRISQQVFMDQPLAEWEFVIFEAPEINAFAMPGGKVGVFMGLFEIARNEEELASVIAHEIAHVTANHTHERMSQAMAAQMGGQVLNIAAAIAGPVGLGGGTYINPTGTIMGLYGMGASGMITAWDRGKEAEADHIGIIYMARAGYNPEAAIRVMERMVEMENGMPSSNYGSTHPSSLERLNELHGHLDQAMQEYEQAKEFQF